MIFMLNEDIISGHIEQEVKRPNCEQVLKRHPFSMYVKFCKVYYLLFIVPDTVAWHVQNTVDFLVFFPAKRIKITQWSLTTCSCTISGLFYSVLDKWWKLKLHPRTIIHVNLHSLYSQPYTQQDLSKLILRYWPINLWSNTSKNKCGCGRYTARGWIFVLYLWVRLRRSIGIFIVILKVDISATSRKLLNRNKQNTLKCYNIINKNNHYDEL